LKNSKNKTTIFYCSRANLNVKVKKKYFHKQFTSPLIILRRRFFSRESHKLIHFLYFPAAKPCPARREQGKIVPEEMLANAMSAPGWRPSSGSPTDRFASAQWWKVL